jgi:hypothetical protein
VLDGRRLVARRDAVGGNEIVDQEDLTAGPPEPE